MGWGISCTRPCLPCEGRNRPLCRIRGQTAQLLDPRDKRQLNDDINEWRYSTPTLPSLFHFILFQFYALIAFILTIIMSALWCFWSCINAFGFCLLCGGCASFRAHNYMYICFEYTTFTILSVRLVFCSSCPYKCVEHSFSRVGNGRARLSTNQST